MKKKRLEASEFSKRSSLSKTVLGAKKCFRTHKKFVEIFILLTLSTNAGK